jgi:hypothetical protein
MAFIKGTVQYDTLRHELVMYLVFNGGQKAQGGMLKCPRIRHDAPHHHVLFSGRSTSDERRERILIKISLVTCRLSYHNPTSRVKMPVARIAETTKH